MEGEHIIERVTIPYFLEYIQTLELELADDTTDTAPAPLTPISWQTIYDFMGTPYNEWPGAPAGTPTGILFQGMLKFYFLIHASLVSMLIL